MTDEKTGTDLVTTKEEKVGGLTVQTRALTAGIAIAAPEVFEVAEDVRPGEETGIDDAVPENKRLGILRPLAANSAQCQPVEDGGLGAKQGDIFNTATGEIYPGRRGLYIIAAWCDEKYINWKRREKDGSGGGFVSVHEPDDPLVRRRIQEAIEKHGDTFRKLENGVDEESGRPLELVDTFYIYAICVHPDEAGRFPGEYGQLFFAMIPFSSTQIKQYSAWRDRIKTLRYLVRERGGQLSPQPIAMWGHVWHLRSHLEKKGNLSWWGWRLSLAGKDEQGAELPYKHSKLPTANPLFAMAEELRREAMAGQAVAEYEKDSSTVEEGAAAEPAEPGEERRAAGKTDIPF